MHTDDSPTSPTTSNANRAAVRASPLHRGEACLTCRRRKMKCDAAKPHCGPCSRAGKADECEYEETRFLAQISRLEDENAALRARVDELERSAGSTSFLPQQQQPFTAFMPGQGRRSPSDGGGDGGSSGGQPSPYGQSAPLLVPHHTHQQPLSPYTHHYDPHHQQQQHALPSIVTQPVQQQPQDWTTTASPGGSVLALHDPIQPHILQRLMQIFTRVASTQFALPQSSIALLAARRGSGALLEAACAAACVFARPNNGMGAWEGMFAQRAALALARSDTGAQVHDLQAQAILAVLSFVGGRALEGQRHLGGALRVARALGLPDAGGETWWMLCRVERAWAPVVGDLGDPAPAGVEVVKQEYDYYGGVGGGGVSGDVGCKGAQLAAKAWALVGDNPNNNPAFWPDVHTTTAALERLLATPGSSTSLGVVAAAALCVLHAAVSAREQARGAAARVVALISAGGGEVEGMEAVVGWWITRVLAVARRELDVGAVGVLERAVERAAAVWPYLGAGRV